MNVIFKEQFLKQIDKLVDKRLRAHLLETITEIESCKSYTEINNLKKLKGYKNFYRIRIGDYRIGVKIENETVTFSAFHHRKDIYKYFP
jgi:mRNA interferase RelE/StbE